MEPESHGISHLQLRTRIIGSDFGMVAKVDDLPGIWQTKLQGRRSDRQIILRHQRAAHWTAPKSTEVSP